MCGIVGYIGKNSAKDYLLGGLEKLEYRGYDSSGISVLQNGEIETVKSEGELENLKEKIKNCKFLGSVGIGHTRWATHGRISLSNAHPHISMDKKISVVHNGIIENFEKLKEDLIKKGYKFVSETDSEVIAHLISDLYKGNLLDAVIKTTKLIEGSYAIGVISAHEPDKIIAAKKDSPLAIGVKKDENFVASDIGAIIKHTKDVYFLCDKEFAVLYEDKVTLYDDNKNEINREFFKADFDINDIQKGGFDHFMIKEIYEQPQAIKDTLNGRVIKGEKIKFDLVDADFLKDIKRIFIVACGTAYHASLVGKYAIERLANIPVEVDFASEFRYRNPPMDKNTLLVLVSQSGETADTLFALKGAKEKGIKTLAITNVVSSTISQDADFVFYTRAGHEISVASTKAYITQLISMYIFALFIAQEKNTVEEKTIEKLKEELLNLPKKVQKTLENKEDIKNIAKIIADEKNVFYLGRGMDYFVAMEGSLKLKEISYIHSQSYAGGELKHGPIALIEDKTKVIAINTNKNLKRKMESNVREVISRGAFVVGVVPESFENTDNTYDMAIKIPDTHEIFSPVIAIVPLQLLAYYVAKEKGYNVDKPRNLAKSVTVE